MEQMMRTIRSDFGDMAASVAPLALVCLPAGKRIFALLPCPFPLGGRHVWPTLRCPCAAASVLAGR